VQVTVFTTPNCVQCSQTKKVLDREKIRYDVVDLTLHPESMEMVKALGYTAAPVVVAGGRHWSGFRMDELNNLSKRIHADEAKK
jgi:glutaredoxin-like protein NrdH